MSPDLTLYAALAFYLAGTLLVLAGLFNRSIAFQRYALFLMIAGFVLHTIWIGTICVRTGHPPLTNLPETAAFISWTIFAAEMLLYFKFRIRAAAFFVYPLVLILLSVAAVVREPYLPQEPSLRSGLFTMHLLFSTVGVAALLVSLAFTLLSQMQERSLKSKSRGALFEWIPSLKVCDLVSYRSLATGFSIYTLGLLAGVLWAYRTSGGFFSGGAKEVGAIVAWVMFAILLQSYLDGSQRTRKTLVVAAVAFVSIGIAIFGIHHV
ncbi:MAG TPA: cytochrome c biogenesis protein CcsA [Thermoanaerobaculia bacterium]|nr:cytochrome c biogenesis protein CcsA [Thermoanaerobaculia bacterium]